MKIILFLVFVLVPAPCLAAGIDFLSLLPPDKRARAETCLAANDGYRAQIEDANGGMVPNPESAYIFANKRIRKFLKDHWDAYEVRVAVDAARKAALAKAEGEM